MNQQQRKRLQEWAEAHTGPDPKQCKHEVLVIHNDIITCTECRARRLA